MTVKILTEAEVPEHLVNEWLQHLRNFDTAHPGCHFSVIADAYQLSVKEIINAMRVDPELPVQELINAFGKKRKRPDHH